MGALQNIPNSGKPHAGNPEPRQRSTREGVETRRDEPTYTCRVCQTDKTADEFYKKDRDSGRRDTTCKCCRIIKQRERVLGVTQEQYLQMLKAQKSRCGICQSRLYTKRYKRFCVDHCHTTGRIRGLLCHPCNMALGGFRDNPEYLQRAIEWVKG